MTAPFPPWPPGSNKKWWNRARDFFLFCRSSRTCAHRHILSYILTGRRCITLQPHHLLHPLHPHTQISPPLPLLVTGVCVQFTFPQYFSGTFPGPLKHLGPCWWWRQGVWGVRVVGCGVTLSLRTKTEGTFSEEATHQCLWEPVTSVSGMWLWATRSQMRWRRRQGSLGSMRTNTS